MLVQSNKSDKSSKNTNLLQDFFLLNFCFLFLPNWLKIQQYIFPETDLKSLSRPLF